MPVIGRAGRLTLGSMESVMAKKTKKLPAGMAFLTGSHAYGTPRADSDVDLVVLLSKRDMDKLRTLANGGDYPETENYIAAGGLPLRFGRLNLICCRGDLYDIWRRGTARLKKRARRTGRPVTRAEAVEYLHKKRREAGYRA